MTALARSHSSSASTPQETPVRPTKGQRRLRGVLAVGLLLAGGSMIAVTFFAYFFGTPNWGVTLDSQGPYPICYGTIANDPTPTFCSTTYQWTIGHVDVAGLAFNDNISSGSVLCGYIDAQGNSVLLNGSNYYQVTANDLITAPTLIIPAHGHDICDFRTTLADGYESLIFALGDYFIALLCVLLAALLFFHGTQRNLVHHTVLFLLSLMLSFALLPLSFTANGMVRVSESVLAVLITPTLLSTLIWRLLFVEQRLRLLQLPRRWIFTALFVANSGIGLGLLFATLLQWEGFYQILSAPGDVLIVLNLVIALSVVIWGNISRRNLVLRDNARILGVGSIIALSPLLFLTVLPTLIGNLQQLTTHMAGAHQPILPGTTAAITLVAFPLALAYVVLKRDLLRTDVLVRRSTEQGIWLLFLAFFSGVVLSVLTVIPALHMAPQVSVTIFAVLLLVGFLAPTLRRGARWVTDAGLFPEMQRYRRLLRSAASGVGQIEEQEITNELIGEIKLALPIRAVALLVRHDAMQSFESVTDAYPLSIPEEHPLLAEMRNKPGVRLREDLTTPLAFIDTRDAPWACFVPVVLEKRMVALLLLGPRDDGLGYSTPDRDLVSTLANRRAVSLDYSRLLATLRASLEEQKRIDALKDQFIMTAHHELRTPLTSMIGYMDIVSQLGTETWQKQPEEIEFMVSAALRSGEDLVHLLDTLLQADRASVSNPDLHHIALNFAVALKTLVSDAEMSAAEQQHRITLQCPPNLAGWVDPKAFRQIVTNLLTNAIKYSPIGSPIIVAAQHLPDGALVEVTVRDQGNGITPDQQTAIFEKFIRLERDLNSTVRGTGLGLAIVRERTQAMGGTAWVESTGIPGEGSTFHVTFPAATMLPATATPTIPRPAAALPVPTPPPAEEAEEAEEADEVDEVDEVDVLTDTGARRKLVRYGPPPEET